MSRVTYQTIKLSRGKHSNPNEGACVMELASMLAGEPFTDHPRSVCPVIGSLLRAYNDYVDDRRRQDLYAYASKVVGSRGSAEVQRRRIERLSSWASERLPRRWSRFIVPAFLRMIDPERTPPIDSLGLQAVRAISKHGPEAHGEVLALVEELLTISARRDQESNVITPRATSSRPTADAPITAA
jgi:hypothetical protein